MTSVKGLLARVRDGRLCLDVRTSLPEGTAVPLCVADEGDDLTAAERTKLVKAIDESWAELRAGKRIPAREVLRKLRTRG